MKLLEVHLGSADLAAQRDFYAGVLGLQAEESAERLNVQVGQTRLIFGASAPLPSPYHLAFDVPEHCFAAARTWIRSRLPLLREDGQDSFFSEDWNAHMLYFNDPEGNILELIARHTLPRPEEKSGALLNVSEVGLAVADVLGTLQHLTDRLGVGAYLSHSASFAPAGTPEGLFILVAEGRSWFPTEQAAGPLPVRILAQTSRAGQVILPHGPVQITGVLGP